MLRTRTSPFQPTIAEVLAALEAAKIRRESVARQITDITTARDWYVRNVDEERQKAAEAERQHRLQLEHLSAVSDGTDIPF
jgi:hypothetical protein